MLQVTIPKTIILDLSASFLPFCKAVDEYNLSHDTTPELLMQEMWCAMAYKEVRDEMSWQALFDLVETEIGYDNDKETAQKFESLIRNMASEIYEAVDLHDFYGKLGYLPYNLEVKGHLFVLKRDDDIIKVQNELALDDDAEEGEEGVQVILPEKV